MKTKKSLPEIDLFQALSRLDSADKVHRFLKDLCTPQELSALQERWRICQLLYTKQLSYREIHEITGASLTTIGRVARFLHTEPHRGYQGALELLAHNKNF